MDVSKRIQIIKETDEKASEILSGMLTTLIKLNGLPADKDKTFDFAYKLAIKQVRAKHGITSDECGEIAETIEDVFINGQPVGYAPTEGDNEVATESSTPMVPRHQLELAVEMCYEMGNSIAFLMKLPGMTGEDVVSECMGLILEKKFTPEQRADMLAYLEENELGV